jgi:hypothetical protein
MQAVGVFLGAITNERARGDSAIGGGHREHKGFVARFRGREGRGRVILIALRFKVFVKGGAVLFDAHFL